jgi:alanine racemase
MILGGSSPDQTGDLIKHEIIQTVYDLDIAKEFSQAALNYGSRLKVHVKIDTGMSRRGFEPCSDEDLNKVCEVCSLKGLEVEGIFTHFATSEVPGDPFHEEQISRFLRFSESLESRGYHIPIRHAANSGAIINIKDSYFNLVRPGLALFGLYPGPGLEDKIDLRPAMQLRAQIAQVHSYNKPVTVSYGRKFASGKPIKTATVTIGYADGLFRTLSGKMDMLVKGIRVPQIGNICMDMSIIDVTQVPDVREGDTVTLFGTDNGVTIPVEELAEHAGTISYEIVCALSGRVGRRYDNFMLPK